MRILAATVLSVLLSGVAPVQPSAVTDKPAATPDALAAELDALRAPRVAWRGIAWKTCLLDGLRMSRAQQKPVLLWIFIDRPIDDARC